MTCNYNARVFVLCSTLLLFFGFCFDNLLVAQAPVLVGSLHVERGPDPDGTPDDGIVSESGLQSRSMLPTRANISGDQRTIGEVTGTITVMSGHQVGVNDYNGFGYTAFFRQTNFVDLNRFGSDPASQGGLITWDYDLSSVLDGETIGTASGNSAYSLDVTWLARRAASVSGAVDGAFYISVDGNGLSLDSTDISTVTTGGDLMGNASGVNNFAIVSDSQFYQQVGTAVAGGDGTNVNPDAGPEIAGEGSFSVDITPFVAAAQNSNGIVRIAYLEPEFRGDISFLDRSGIVRTIVDGTGVSLGDFDNDGDVDLDDLDQYNGNLGEPAAGNLAALDLDGDGTVGANDFQQHYETLVETSNGGKGTAAGDVNLDGVVNVLGDAFALIGNLNNAASSWSQGDLNADGTVNVLGDAFLLVGNLGADNGGAATAPSASAVPEPGSVTLLFLAAVLNRCGRRRVS